MVVEGYQRLSCTRAQFVGHADLPLEAAYNLMQYPVTPDCLNLVTVIDHPVLAPMWEAHVHKELSAENTDFFKVARDFQAWAVGRTCPCACGGGKGLWEGWGQHVCGGAARRAERGSGRGGGEDLRPVRRARGGGASEPARPHPAHAAGGVWLWGGGEGWAAA